MQGLETGLLLARAEQADSQRGLDIRAVARLSRFLEQQRRLAVIALPHVGGAQHGKNACIVRVAAQRGLQHGDGALVLALGQVDAAQELARTRLARPLVEIGAQIALGALEFAQRMVGQTAQQLQLVAGGQKFRRQRAKRARHILQGSARIHGITLAAEIERAQVGAARIRPEMLVQVIDIDFGLVIALQVEQDRGARQTRIDIERLDFQRTTVVACRGLQVALRMGNRREHVERVTIARG